MAIRTDILERKSDILKWIDDQEPKAEIARRLGCKIDTLNSYLGKMNIEYKGNQGGKGKKTDPKRKSAEELSEWMGKPIPLELHHKDGNHYNNDLSNLEILCPNCHAQTDNYSRRG